MAYYLTKKNTGLARNAQVAQLAVDLREHGYDVEPARFDWDVNATANPVPAAVWEPALTNARKG